MNCEEAYNKIADTYDLYFSDIKSLEENKRLFECIKTEKVSGGDILDVGCGTGIFLEYVNSVHYTGLDISGKMLDVARKKFPTHNFIKGDMQNMPFENSSFDVLFSLFGGFSYCHNPTSVVTEAFRILKDCGKFFIMVMAHSYKHKKSHITVKYKTPTYFRTYSNTELNNLFRQQNFKDVQITNFNSYFWNVTGRK